MVENIEVIENYLKDKSIIETSKILSISYSTLRKLIRINNIVHKSKQCGLYNIDLEVIKETLNKSTSYSNALMLLGFAPRSNNLKSLKKIISINSIIFKFIDRNDIFTKTNIYDCSLKKFNSDLSRSVIKRYIISNNLIEYKCKICGNLGNYNRKPLVLQLDHINGICNDNRLDNLRFLCPNCHSQTDTFTGKLNKGNYKKYYCKDCGSEIRKQSIRCNKCASKLRGQSLIRFNVSDDELLELVNKYSYRTISKIYKVSDNTVRKRYLKIIAEQSNGS